MMMPTGILDYSETCNDNGDSKRKTQPHLYQLHGIDIPSTQDAIVTTEVGPSLALRLQRIPVRDPEIGEAVVKLLCTGVCRSDIYFSVGPEPGFPQYNHIAGHEGIGRVVQSHDPAVLGRLVAIQFLASACDSCGYCLRGLQTSCPRQLNTTKDISGTFQMFATLPVSCLLPLSEEILNNDTHIKCCAALCSGSAAFRALRGAQTQSGDVLLVVGVAGGIGHLVGTMAKNTLGLRVIGVDKQSKLETLTAEQARRISHVLIPAPEEDVDNQVGSRRFKDALLEACTSLRGGIGVPRGAETVIVAGSEMGAFRHLEDYVCDGGQVICLGVPRGENTLAIPLPALVERSLRISGSLMGGRQEALEVMELIKSGRVEPLISEISLSDVPEYMNRLQHGTVVGKIVVRISG